MGLKELQEKREQLVVTARAALDEITKNTDSTRTAELDQRHDAIMVEFDAIDAQIGREERMAKIEKAAAERRAQNRPNPGDGEARGVDDGEADLTYRSVFHKLFVVGGDPSELNRDERSVLRRGAASAEFRSQTTGTAAAGGYTVPTELSNQIIKSMKLWGPMYDEDICTVLNTASGNPIKLPTVDDTAVAAGKHTEGTALTDDGSSDVVFGQKALDAYMYDTEFVRFSHELAQDSVFNFEALLGDLLGERLARIANRELTIGDGNGDPNGVVTASGLGVTAATATAITYDELINLVHSVDPAYRQGPKVRFQLHDLTLSAIRKIKDSEGRYIWTAGDVQGGVPGTILGYRYSINQAMDTLAASKKVALFGDFGKYFVRKVGSPVIGVLRERFWPDLGVAGLIRFDGELGDAAAVKHLITAA